MANTNNPKWNAEFCGCLKSVPACCMVGPTLQGLTIFQMGQGKEGSGVKNCLLAQFTCCIGSALNRGKVRERYDIPGSFITDCLLYMCCGICMGTQEYREVQLRNNTK